MTLDSLVTELSGVGKTRAKQLEKLNIRTLSDLVYCFPYSYENRSIIYPLFPVRDGINSSYILTVSSEVKSAKIRNSLTISKFKAFDESGACEIVFFNSPFVKDLFHIGSVFRFTGKAAVLKGKIQLTNPKYEPYVEGIALPEFIPQYHLTDGLSGKILDKLINSALSSVISDIVDPLPDNIRVENELSTLTYALKNVHNPENEDALRRALRRLAFDEIFYFSMGVSLSTRYKNATRGVRFMPCNMKEFTDILPYQLTAGQKNAINDIYSDTVIKTKNEDAAHMARILVGDVGCGKTVCAAAAIFIAAKSNYQSALMAPTEILARQHYLDLAKLFDALNIKCALLLGSTSAKEKKAIYSDLESGKIDLIVGTHALLSEKVVFNKLGLVITDEQHRFGVAQRAALNDKSKSAHMLVMSATPIPRTLALAMYGDLDISRITEMPKGRQNVETFVVNESYRRRINDFITKQVALGGQCYIVCPAIESKPSVNADDVLLENYISFKNNSFSNLHNVNDYAVNLRQNLPNLKIECLHGKVKAAEKDQIMSQFSLGQTDVLVSTTVIEVGVNVPNASLMIIENADRYGLSQLHQLRGRVGRGKRKSYCILVSDINTEKSRERLEIMRTTYDGFEIANRDLEIRGPGDFFKTKEQENFRQSGGFNFKLAPLSDDNSLFELAFSLAKSIISKDPDLILPEHRELKFQLQKIIAPITSSIS